MLTCERLETIRMLTNQSMDQDSPLACLLIGQPTLASHHETGRPGCAGTAHRAALHHAWHDRRRDLDRQVADNHRHLTDETRSNTRRGFLVSHHRHLQRRTHWRFQRRATGTLADAHEVSVVAQWLDLDVLRHRLPSTRPQGVPITSVRRVRLYRTGGWRRSPSSAHPRDLLRLVRGETTRPRRERPLPPRRPRSQHSVA